MADVEKYHDYRDIGHMLKHDARTVAGNNYGNAEIDLNRLDEDRKNYAPAGNDNVQHIKDVINRVADGKTIRKDAVKMCSWIIQAPQKYAGNLDAFFQGVYDFNAQRYGAGMGGDNIISAHVHMSETTPHMHFAFVPVKNLAGKQSLCARDVICQKDLKTYHQDLEKYLTDRNLCRKGDMRNGNTQRDAHGRALSVRELKQRDREITHSRWRTHEREIEHEQERSRWR